jgi:hypothetical protein
MSNKNKLPEYPDSTPGSKLAAEVRKQANSLSDAKRATYMKRGMAMIYGVQSPTKATSTRH